MPSTHRKTVTYNGERFRIGVTKTVGGQDCCDLCHFHAASYDDTVVCPRVKQDYLLCSDVDKYPVGLSTYLIRDTKQGRAEHIVRKMTV